MRFLKPLAQPLLSAFIARFLAAPVLAHSYPGKPICIIASTPPGDP